MRAVVKKWENSASVRIPAAVLKAAHLGLDEPVDVREESGRIVIAPPSPRHTSNDASPTERTTTETQFRAIQFASQKGA
jgi:antitoxin MazE